VTYRPLQPELVPCRSCKALIFFATVTKTGKKIPMDPEAVDDGNIVLSPDCRDAEVLGPGEAPTFPGRKYRSHFATCPDAKGWRRKRGIPEPDTAAWERTRAR